METGSYVYRLNDYARRKGFELHYEESDSGPVHDKTYIRRVVLNGKVYPDGEGKTKKEAKQNAAKNALRGLLENEHQDSADTTADEKYDCTSAQQNEASNQNVSDICNKMRHLSGSSQRYRDQQRQGGTNYIGIVDHYCQKTRRCHSYIEERRCGTVSNPIFFYKLMIDKKLYPEGEGKTVKEAKQNAARLGWSALQEQSDWDSKVSIRSTVSEDDAPTGLSTPTSLESLASSQSMSTGTSGSGIFTDSSNSSKDQHTVKDQNMGNSQNETSIQSRFTSDFDPMECLGSGAFGCVYKVKHKLLNKYYAVKIVCREEKSLREVETLSDLHHCNIVRYYTFWMEDSAYQWHILADSNSSSQSTDNSSAKYLYIQMELCDTKTLKVWIDEKNDQSLQDSKRREGSLSIAQQIVSGVEYIHSKKNIHRDLKPENILFGLDGEVKIGDFGLVTIDDDDDDALMERTGHRGTTTYMAPEQKREKTYDRKVDIFALGLIYFELLWKLSTGHERVVVWDDARSQKLPEEFSRTFPQETQIINSMLCEKPEERPEASKLKAELEKWAQTYNAQNVHQENATV
ncbi:interferon-induced, double-stranded RNA-activated protein kinase-like isoform X2 [Sebastes umbrosus]|uniref:interferon-induced, double-stranded RNA-activated protein kinase-like isoform X2 n=1 Tax=Sebastes umbrosus TaxID=72105 RepID=UPI00189F2B85|nr:interferon-induced, double-stranded RNA-activated protein kinase-like isoform X2 [Sebastes umbrosus]